ncbi:MAG TPA: hypothetical protein VGE01_03635 [Fimbriimonas sp.]
MHYLLHLRLQGFYARVLGAEYEGRPLVVHRDKRVLDACPLAQGGRIEVGMGLAEARAILGHAAFVPWREEPYRAAQAEWLDLCAEYTDVIEPGAQHTALIDLSEHPDPRSLADALVRRLSDDLGYSVLAGNGNCRWVAELASSMDYGTEPLLLPPMFVRNLPTARMATLSPEHRDRLIFLGYRRIGDVAQIPLEVLRSQFGDAAFEIFRAARGGGNPTVEAQWPHGCLASRMSFDGPPQDVMGLMHGVRQVAESLGENLVNRDLQGREVHLFLEHEDGRVGTLRRTFARPLQSPGSVYTCLKLMLAEPPEEPVVGVRVRMPNLEKAQRVQLELEGQRSLSDRELSAAAAFQHIRRVFGDTAVMVAGQMPEPRRWKLLRLWKGATGWA